MPFVMPPTDTVIQAARPTIQATMQKNIMKEMLSRAPVE
jgi:hypothetical protein